jgi:signal transduction histidine kinase
MRLATRGLGHVAGWSLAIVAYRMDGMTQGYHISRLTRRAYWLIRLRWVAIASMCLMTFAAHRLLAIDVQVVPIFAVAGLLVIENLVALLGLKHAVQDRRPGIPAVVRRNIHFQISTDLVLLTLLLHYSGGIENPFVVYFVFHMAIASSLLSVRESYLLATLAVTLLTLMTWLEFKGFVPHYCLRGFIANGFHADGFYIFGTVTALASMLYLVVFMTSDIATKLHQQERAYRQANEVLEQKDRIKDEYVARVTHDIKGHLAAIQSCHEVVICELQDPLSKQQRNFMERAYRRTKTLTKFVRKLLELTEMRLSNHLEMGVFSLREVVVSAVTGAEGKAQDKGVALSYTVDPQVDTVFGNVFSIEETLSNLVLNAIKYTPAPGSVDIHVVRTKQGVRVEVADTGIGIPPGEMPKVFDEFFRATNARQSEKDGTGLGLSIAKQIVERHGGTIGVQARPGGGSVFYFELPENRLREEDATIAELPAKTPRPVKDEVHT